MRPPLEICILAAGQGKRMKSARPKVLHTIAGKPMLAHLLATAQALQPTRIHVVIGRGAEAVRRAFVESPVNFVQQEEQLGTGHAVMQALPQVSSDARLLILVGDAPLVTAETLACLVAESCDLGILTVDAANPFNYGRIVRGEGVKVERIVEERDADPEEQKINEINTGIMIADVSLLSNWLSHLTRDNNQKEYLLTDIVGIASRDGLRVHAVKAAGEAEVSGVNNRAQLAALEREYQRRQAEHLMAAGVQLLDPARLDVRGELIVGADVTIDINCVFEGQCRLGNNVTIGPNCLVRDVMIGDNVEIRANSVIEGARIGEDCTIGPFARIRPGTVLARGVGIGNFVEVKNTTVGEGTKASHLSYLGDATLGAGVNIGAGTITCNYDGQTKHQTHIGDHVFVGSNTALVAPVELGSGATIGAGSTITRNVDPGQLAVARGRQKNISHWKRPDKS